jgi:hypothetical protein
MATIASRLMNMPPLIHALLAAALTTVGMTALVARRSALRGTTLIAPWWWSVLAVATLGLTEMALAWAPSNAAWTTHARFLSAATTLCPMMAVLGAKRPQDRAWQLIVAALLLVVVWPAVQALAFRPDRPLMLHPAWRGFVSILWLLGLVNGLPTRHALATLAAGLGQGCLLADLAPAAIAQVFPGTIDATMRVLLGLACCAAAIVLWAWRLCPDRAGCSGGDRAWLDFRDLYGAVWGLRVAERFNAAAEQHAWPCKLGWRGIVARRAADDAADGAASRDPPPAARQALLGLLRRFVDEAWIAERWPPS